MNFVADTYLPFMIIGGFVLIVAIHHAWHRRIRPLLIPAQDIRLLTDDLIARHGERAEEAAFINEDRAWRYSDVVEQGIWRRVRKEVRRRFPD